MRHKATVGKGQVKEFFAARLTAVLLGILSLHSGYYELGLHIEKRQGTHSCFTDETS